MKSTVAAMRKEGISRYLGLLSTFCARHARLSRLKLTQHKTPCSYIVGRCSNRYNFPNKAHKYLQMDEEQTQSIKIPGWARCPLNYIKHAIIRETLELDGVEQNTMDGELREPTESNPPPALSTPTVGFATVLDSFENEAIGNSPKMAFVVTNNSSALDTRGRSD